MTNDTLESFAGQVLLSAKLVEDGHGHLEMVFVNTEGKLSTLTMSGNCYGSLEIPSLGLPEDHEHD